MNDHRVDPPYAADERTSLIGFLDYHRETLRQKLDGLDATQLTTTLAPSDMTLGGMMKHLALVEHWWFDCVLRGHEFVEPWASVDWDADDDWDWHSAAEDTPAQIRILFDESVTASDAILATTGGLEVLSKRAGRQGEHFSLRWILLHLIEEYARHNGHADLLREAVDGVTGE